MARQSLLWTALPNGYADDPSVAAVTVLVSPHWKRKPTRSSFRLLVTPGLATLGVGAASVSIKGDDTASPAVSMTRSAQPIQPRGRALPGTTFVRGFTFEDMRTGRYSHFLRPTSTASVCRPC